MDTSEILHKFRQRACIARPPDSLSHGCAVPAPSKRELFEQIISHLGNKLRRTRRGAHRAPAFCAEFAFCSIIERITEILDFEIPVNAALCQQAAAPSKEGAFLIFGEENGRDMRFYDRR